MGSKGGREVIIPNKNITKNRKGELLILTCKSKGSTFMKYTKERIRIIPVATGTTLIKGATPFKTLSGKREVKNIGSAENRKYRLKIKKGVER